MPPIFALVIVLALIVAGVAIALPLARFLGRALEKRLEGSGELGAGAAGDLVPILRRIEERMDAIEGEQERLREHQDFMDALLEKREPPRIADRGGPGDAGEG